jgi:hypothetical protein
LAFTSYRRATADTEAPGAVAAATISRFSASGQDLYRKRCTTTLLPKEASSCCGCLMQRA